MANMQFYYGNLINTLTMVTVSVLEGGEGIGTGTLKNLFDRDETSLYRTAGLNSDNTNTTIDIKFASATNITTIIYQNMNARYLFAAYNSNAANKFSLTVSTEGTQTSHWNNFPTYSYAYLDFATIAVNSVRIITGTTHPANEEKEIGELWILNRCLTFGHNPSARQYKTNFYRKEYVHQMSDGGTEPYILADRYKADIKRTYVSENEKDILEDIHDLYSDIVFVPAPTANSWDGEIWQVNWIGDFDFDNYTDNYRDNGFSGNIKLREIPR